MLLRFVLLAPLLALSLWAIQSLRKNYGYAPSIYVPELTTPGQVLYVSGSDRKAFLIDALGRRLQTWGHSEGPSWQEAKFLRNKNLMVLAESTVSKDDKIVPGNFLEFNSSGSLVWKSPPFSIHHDFQELEGDRILALGRDALIDPSIHPSNLFLSDYLFIFDRNGKIHWRWNLIDHYKEFKKFGVNTTLQGFDWAHTNSIQVLPETPKGEKDKRFQAGNILVGFHKFNTIGIIDFKTGQLVWAWGQSEIRRTHQVRMLPSGNILLFDNGDADRPYSRIIELDPKSEKIVWQYPKQPDFRFFNSRRGGVERLLSGNTLITDSAQDRIFEIDREGKIVWELRPFLKRRLPYLESLQWALDLTNSQLYRASKYPQAEAKKASFR